MAFTTPSIRYIKFEFRDVFYLFPHSSNAELGPLRDSHGGDLVGPEDILLSTKYGMEEGDGTVLLLWEEDILIERRV